MDKIKQLIGKVKQNKSEGWQEFEGIHLIVLKLENSDDLLVISPVTLDEMKKFYKLSYEKSLKELISEDLNYCIWYVLNPDCELTLEININLLEDIRPLTENDVKEYDKNLDQFKKICGYYEHKKKLEIEAIEDTKALEKFKKADKSKVSIQTKEGFMEVDALVYKGFAIHNIPGSIDCDLNTNKSITILSGEYKGICLTQCSVSKCKQFIDEIIETIGDKVIEDTDRDKLLPIIQRY